MTSVINTLHLVFGLRKENFVVTAASVAGFSVYISYVVACCDHPLAFRLLYENLASKQKDIPEKWWTFVFASME